ncbi:MGDG synthase family glycosyltransferase [Planococcus sp. CAU13]|uniref:MGDG synthase family glycosyltransferase n=1 Tax=Planococcus sp. CAU13 TaxID=1541197 RepID=UPI00052FEEF0|nr:hypothetical protein [Planococcus sp. CAU13]
MKKVLIFPLLDSMPSGHHQVANAIRDSILAYTGEIECLKVDILSEWNVSIEGGIVKTYLEWIRRFPGTYAWTYRRLAYRSRSERPHKVYELLFMKKVKDILNREQPDLIICTHGFPSLFINRLKQSGDCRVPALNVYTDFFINDVWGRSHIDYHFVPSMQVKNNLSARHQIAEEKIFITGIPISPEFSVNEEPSGGSDKPPFRIIMSGGSVGLGNIAEMLKAAEGKTECRIDVLCGANKKLYNEIRRLAGGFATAHPYISSREEMNRLYEESDALISKPGGVTVSEALRKEIPIFISSALPGQEQINLQLLDSMGLVFIIPEEANAIEFVCGVLGNKEKMAKFEQAAAEYRNTLEIKDARELFSTIEEMLERG